MIDDVQVMVQRAATPISSWPQRLGWLILIWIAGITALAIVAALFRIPMNAAGLTS